MMRIKRAKIEMVSSLPQFLFASYCHPLIQHNPIRSDGHQIVSSLQRVQIYCEKTYSETAEESHTLSPGFAT